MIDAHIALMMLNKLLFVIVAACLVLEADRPKHWYDATARIQPYPRRPSDRKLGLRPRAPAMRTLRVPRELHDLRVLELQHLLEFLAQTEQDVAALLGAATFAAGNVAFAASWHALADGLGPEAHAVETFAHVDDNAHDFAVVVVVLEGFADGGEHDVEPEFVDGGAAFVWRNYGQRGRW